MARTGRSVGRDRVNRGPVSKQVWHDKDPSCLKAIGAARRDNVYQFPARFKEELPVDALVAISILLLVLFQVCFHDYIN